MYVVYSLKLIKPKSKTLQPLTFVDGSAFVSTFYLHRSQTDHCQPCKRHKYAELAYMGSQDRQVPIIIEFIDHYLLGGDNASMLMLSHARIGRYVDTNIAISCEMAQVK